MNNFSKATAVIFDMDGLLIDSEPFWDKAHEAFFKKYNLQDSEEIREKTHGAGVSDNIKLFQKELGLTGDVSELTDEYRNLFYEFALQDVELMPGAMHLIHNLSKNTFQLAIATGGHTEEKIKEILEKFKILQYFPTLISSDMVEKGKPDPAVYIKTADVLGVDPSDCVVLEDSVNGTKSGKAAGMSVVGINPDQSYREKLSQANADMVVSRLDELIDIFSSGCCGQCNC